MNVIIGSYLKPENPDFEYFMNIIKFLHKTGNSVLPIAEFELNEINKMVKTNKEDDIVYTNNMIKSISEGEKSKVKTLNFMLFEGEKDCIDLKEYFDFDNLNLGLAMNGYEPVDVKKWNPIFEIADSISTCNGNFKFEMKNSKLKRLKLDYKRRDQSEIILYDTIPESVEELVYSDIEKNGIVEFMKKVPKRLPGLKVLKLLVYKEIPEVEKFKELIELEICVSDLAKTNFNFCYGFPKNTNLKKVIFSTKAGYTKILFVYGFQFPDSVSIIYFNDGIEISRLGYISGSGVVRFLPPNLKELRMTLNRDLKTTLNYEGKLINLIPDVGILHFDIHKNSGGFEIINNVVIPDSVYFLKITLIEPKKLKDYIPCCHKWFVFSEKSEIMQVNIDLSDLICTQILEIIPELAKTIKRKIVVNITGINELGFLQVTNTIKDFRKTHDNLLFLNVKKYSYE